MSFSDADIHERIGGLAGGPAEQAFVRVMDADGYPLGVKLWRFGLEQLTTSGNVAATITGFVRHSPDFVQVGGHMWEIQGCGQDRLFKFKREKLEALWAWHQALRADGRDLRWALYVQPDNVVFKASFEHILWACYEQGEYQEALLDQKDGWLVPAEAFEYGAVTDFSDAFRSMKKDGLL